MIILSDCLTEKVDEGCLKVANSLTQRIKEYDSNTIIVSYNRRPKQSDIHLKLNKLFLNKPLISLIRKKKESVLYIPFASNTKASALRTLFLSLYTGRKVDVLFVLRFSMSNFTKNILRLSGARIIALSEESYEYYNSQIGLAIYLKTGIDTKQFQPVTNKRKQELRQKYHVAEGKAVLLHVGHLKSGRNVDKLLNVGSNYHVFLVVSSVTENEKDDELRNQLNHRPNTTIIDAYLEHIEEIYQMADVYLFPVLQEENCIDVPLSVLEAAACNIPIVTTEYGELKAFKGQQGVYFISDLEKESINGAIDKMSNMKKCNNRDMVLEYDWDNSVERLMRGQYEKL